MGTNGNNKILRTVGISLTAIALCTGYVIATEVRRQGGDEKNREYTHTVEQSQHALERRLEDKLDGFSAVQTTMDQEQS